MGPYSNTRCHTFPPPLLQPLQELIYYDGEAFDIRLIQLVIALIVAPIGGLLGLLGFTFLLWKLPVALVRAEWEVFKAYFMGKGSCFEACLFFVPWLIALALTPAGVLLAGAVSPIGGLLFGFTAAGITSYQARTLLGEPERPIIAAALSLQSFALC